MVTEGSEMTDMNDIKQDIEDLSGAIGVMESFGTSGDEMRYGYDQLHGCLWETAHMKRARLALAAALDQADEAKRAYIRAMRRGLDVLKEARH